MISIDQALQIIVSQAKPVSATESVILTTANGRFLAENIAADRDLPPFNRVAVDGYACKMGDLLKELEMLEIVPAGKKAEKVIGNGKCSKVMTGCALPDGAETVFMVEDSIVLANGKIKFTANPEQVRHGNFSRTGEEVAKGTPIFNTGKQICSGDIGTLSLIGAYNLSVRPKLKIGVIATGDELVEPYEQPETVQIRNSNSYQLLTQIENAGQTAIYYGIVKDEPEAISALFKKATDECDILLLTGGVSAGDFDFVPQIMQANKFTILFDKVAIKPGKPTTFAVRDDKFVFGLPGNPVSCFVIFEIMVKPLIHRLMGSIFSPITVTMELASDFTRRTAERTEFVPVTIQNGLADPVKYHGSGHLQALTVTKGWLRVEKDISFINKGAKVAVRFL